MSLNQQIERWLANRKKSFLENNRPFTTLAYAQSWDGSISITRGKTVAISGKAARFLTHHLRSLHDGILVGIETVIADDPQLTVRECPGNNPQPIVLDSRLRMPAYSKLHHHPDKKCWILTLAQDGSFGESDGNEPLIIKIPNPDVEENFVPLRPAMQLLRAKGIDSLMVEGGAKVITEFLKAGLADAIIITVAPKILGGYQAVGDLGIEDFRLAPNVSPLNIEKMGDDLIVWGDLHYGATR
tara:strand:+ start:1062 stop:1787 length:726 start_codon:yes stop_codon:yes gene_type:complete